MRRAPVALAFLPGVLALFLLNTSGPVPEARAATIDQAHPQTSIVPVKAPDPVPQVADPEPVIDPEEDLQFRRLAEKALRRWEGSGSSAYAHDNRLGLRELQKAGLREGEYSTFLRHNLGDGDGFLTVDEMVRASHLGLLEIDEQSRIRVTPACKELSRQSAQVIEETLRPESAPVEEFFDDDDEVF